MVELNFKERCYKLLRTVPKGKVTTYKDLAEALGTKAYRAVGTAMNRNPYPRHLVPCHRVVNTNGAIGGYADNVADKIERLKQEGLEIKEEKIIDFKNKLHQF